jgi:hypothetical protein
MGDGAIFGGLVAVGVAAFLIFDLYRGRRLSPAEKGLTPFLSASCSVRMGNLGALAHSNFSGIRLAIYPEFFVLGFFSPVLIRLEDITSIKIVTRTFSGRWLAIETANGSAYQISVKDPEEVAKLLRGRVRTSNTSATWICSKCREENPADFDICWKCQSAKEGDRL